MCANFPVFKITVYLSKVRWHSRHIRENMWESSDFAGNAFIDLGKSLLFIDHSILRWPSPQSWPEAPSSSCLGPASYHTCSHLFSLFGLHSIARDVSQSDPFSRFNKPEQPGCWLSLPCKERPLKPCHTRSLPWLIFLSRSYTWLGTRGRGDCSRPNLIWTILCYLF